MFNLNLKHGNVQAAKLKKKKKVKVKNQKKVKIRKGTKPYIKRK